MGKGQALRVEIDVAPAYELVMSLAVLCDAEWRATYENGPSWFDAARAHASPDLLAGVEEFSGQSDLIWTHLLSLAYECPPPRDVSAFLSYLETVDAMEIRLRLLGYYVRYFRRTTPPHVMAAAADGDRTAQREFLRTSRPDDAAWQAALQKLLPLSADETRARLLVLLRRWYEEVFRPQEPEVLPILRRDAEQKGILAQTHSPEGLLETALQGFEYVPEPGIQQILLIPSYVVRPQIHSFEHHEVKIFVCPVSDESVAGDADSPSPRLLRLVKALADERRLRILKRLGTGSYTLQELADHFEVGNTTMLHHLVLLRSAGLVQVQGGAGKRYTLQRGVVSEVGERLEAYLGGGAGSNRAVEERRER